MPQDPICLASASPRRSELLRQIGVAHLIRPAQVDESPLPGESPGPYVQRLAEAKAARGWDTQLPTARRPVLAADTTVAIDGELLGKPRDREDALDMLQRLSGRVHDVYTAVALRHDGGSAQRLSHSRVSFRPVPRVEALWYWDSGEPQDKAGAYAIQGLGAVFVSRIEGSYSGVMGLPLFETWELLAPVLGLTAGPAS